jgi:tRNA(Ile)-lysidine synthase
MGPHPAVAQVRLAVRRSLRRLAPGDLVLAACSGGADSLALAAALAFEAPALGIRGGGVTVDHGLQSGSGRRAAAVIGQLERLGLDPVQAITVSVAAPGQASGPYPGPEAAARTARYAGLDLAAEQAGAVAVLLGHTRDDQAETVLLGLARGSGGRSLAGMAQRSGRYVRPLLQLSRGQVAAACAAEGLEPWQDPQNADQAFARVRVRTRILPLMEELLGPGIAESLARTAEQLRADADALDSIAAEHALALAGEGGLAAEQLAGLPAAIRTRMLRAAALAAGCPAGTLSARHVGELDALVTAWHGQRWVDLPGEIRCQRRYGRLLFTAGE